MISIKIKFEICFLFLIASTFISFAQPDVDSLADLDQFFFGPIEIRSQFPGGEIALFCFIDNNINKELLLASDSQGKSYAAFTIDTTGLVKDVKILKSLNDSIDNEFIRVLKLMPQWSPATIRSIPVQTNWVFPLEIPYKSRCPK